MQASLGPVKIRQKLAIFTFFSLSPTWKRAVRRMASTNGPRRDCDLRSAELLRLDVDRRLHLLPHLALLLQARLLLLDFLRVVERVDLRGSSTRSGAAFRTERTHVAMQWLHSLQDDHRPSSAPRWTSFSISSRRAFSCFPQSYSFLIQLRSLPEPRGACSTAGEPGPSLRLGALVGAADCVSLPL